MTGELRSKDLRKAIDALYKRVDKHFGGDVVHQAADHTDVLRTVWKACEDEMVRLVTAWKGLIAKCYPVSLRPYGCSRWLLTLHNCRMRRAATSTLVAPRSTRSLRMRRHPKLFGTRIFTIRRMGQNGMRESYVQ